VAGNRPRCWGNDSDGQLATGVLTQSALPIALGSAPGPRLDLNNTVGQPGSTFTLIGSGFPPTSTLPVAINGTTLSTTLESNVSGEFMVYLTTADAAAGSYAISIGAETAVNRQIFLQPSAPLQRAEGGGLTIALPADSEGELSTRYLPILRR
jgi:hypothetical protein